jgi:predicted MFS family arabinose efflux permease
MAAFSVASVVGVPVGLYLATAFTWHVPFLAIGGLGIAFIALIYYRVKPMDSHLDDEAGKVAKLELIKDIKQSGLQRRALTLSLVMMLGHFSIIPFLAPYMVSNVGFSERQLTFIYFIGGMVTLVTSPLVGRIADKYGKFPIFAMSLLFACIPIFLITNMPSWPVWAALMVTTLFFASSSGRFVPSQAMIISVVSPRTRGGFMSINSSVQQLGSGLASLIAGVIVVKNSTGQLENYAWVGYLSIASSLFCIWLAKGLVKKQQAKDLAA